jgi:hypothetical protein
VPKILDRIQFLQNAHLTFKLMITMHPLCCSSSTE